MPAKTTSSIPLSSAIQRAYSRYLKLALALPGVETSTSYGTPSVKIRGKILSRWRTEAEGALAIRCDLLDREILLATQPDVFFVTEHYLNYPMVLVRLERASKAQLEDILERAWRRVAPPKLLRAGDPPVKTAKRRRAR